MAHGNFDRLMSFKGDQLTICGPIHWDGTHPLTELPATELTLLCILVAQQGRQPQVSTFTPVHIVRPQPADPPINEWMSTIVGDFVPGPAGAFALVQLAISGRKRQWIFETWSETITIVQD
jgi:hypothetical protein